MGDSSKEELRQMYGQLCNSYHKVDDFRAKLLGLLPLVSGASIFSVLSPAVDNHLKIYQQEIGWFGFVVTAGLLLFELKGIQKCSGFIGIGAELEKKLQGGATGITGLGKFQLLQKEETPWNTLVSEPVASAIIYSAVLAAWLFVATNTYWIWGSSVIFLILIVRFWRKHTTVYLEAPTG